MSRSAVLFTVLSLILCQAAMGGTNHNAKIALHARYHSVKLHCGNLPAIAQCSDIVHTFGDCTYNVAVYVVVYDYVGTLRGVEYGLTWPAGWGTATTTHCGDAAVGDIVSPGDGMAITWNTCTSGGDYWPVAFTRLSPTGAGDVDLICNPATSFIGITDCDSVEYAAVAVYGAGLCGNAGDDPCVNRTWYVDPYGTGDAPTIQAAIDTAAVGDTVLVAAGTYTVDDDNYLRIQDKNIVLRSESGPDSTIIEDTDIYINASLLVSGVTSATHVDGFTFDRGRGYTCGGMYCSGAPRVSNCIFKDCSGDWGGALYAEDSYAEFTDCLFFSNGSQGKQARVVRGSPTFKRCAFDSDIDRHGAVTCDSTSATFSRCEFYNSCDTSAVVIGSLVICRRSAQPTFDSCTFWGNTLLNELNVVLCYGAAEPTFANCTFWGNEAESSHVFRLMEGAQPRLENTIIASNPGAGAICCEDSLSVPTLTCSDIYGNEGGEWTGFIAGQLGLNGNISEDPKFCDADSADFRLFDDSPCITDPGCGQIGAWGVGCESSGAPGREPEQAAFGLLANSPNPFSPETRIAFSLSEPGHVTLTLYDATGRRVTVLADGRYDAGRQSVTWDGKGASGQPLTPGVYFCRLKSGGRTASRKIVLTR